MYKVILLLLLFLKLHKLIGTSCFTEFLLVAKSYEGKEEGIREIWIQGKVNVFSYNRYTYENALVCPATDIVWWALE